MGDFAQALTVNSGKEVDDGEGVEIFDRNTELLFKEAVAIMQDGGTARQIHLHGLAALLLGTIHIDGT